MAWRKTKYCSLRAACLSSASTQGSLQRLCVGMRLGKGSGKGQSEMCAFKVEVSTSFLKSFGSVNETLIARAYCLQNGAGE